MEKIGINTSHLIAQAINFALFFYVFKRFLSKPLISYLKKQWDQEKQRQEALISLKEMESKLQEEQVKIKRQAQLEADKIIKDAYTNAKKIESNLIIEAEEKVKKLVQDTRESLSKEKERLEKDMEEKVLRLSITILREVFREYFDQNSQDDIIARLSSKINFKFKNK